MKLQRHSADGFATSPLRFDAGVGTSPDRPLRVGWLVERGFGPIGSEVAATVQAAAEALKGAGCVVEPVHIPAPEQDNALEVFYRLHVMELKPAFVEATAGRDEYERFKIAKGMLATPDTDLDDFVLAEQAVARHCMPGYLDFVPYGTFRGPE